jgi:hypothetical protein
VILQRHGQGCVEPSRGPKILQRFSKRLTFHKPRVAAAWFGNTGSPEVVPRSASGFIHFEQRCNVPLSVPTGVQSSLLHLPSSWKVNSANFAITEFSEVLSGNPMVRRFPEEYEAVQSPTRSREAVHQAHKLLPSCSPRLTFAMCLSHIIPLVGRESDLMEVSKAMSHEARHDTQEALYSLIAGAEGCGSAARSARFAQDNELADFLSRVQQEVVEEAKRLLAQRVAE